jgi:hypothetical protein
LNALHDEDTGDWLLEIEHATQSDSGIYECQISTSPLKNLAITLTVLGSYLLALTTFFLIAGFYITTITNMGLLNLSF